MLNGIRRGTLTTVPFRLLYLYMQIGTDSEYRYTRFKIGCNFNRGRVGSDLFCVDKFALPFM
jgi:hypothetical protein